MTEQLCDFPTCQLARQKGFDEECLEVWLSSSNEPVPGRDIFAEIPGETLPAQVTRFYEEIKEYAPTKNSELPPGIIARPTQDLLDEWLLEVHGIAIWVCPSLEKGTFNAYHSDGEGGFCIIAVKMPSRKLAREAAIVHALKLLPDANTNYKG